MIYLMKFFYDDYENIMNHVVDHINYRGGDVSGGFRGVGDDGDNNGDNDNNDDDDSDEDGELFWR
jgi:hypothetical protein